MQWYTYGVRSIVEDGDCGSVKNKLHRVLFTRQFVPERHKLL